MLKTRLRFRRKFVTRSTKGYDVKAVLRECRIPFADNVFKMFETVRVFSSTISCTCVLDCFFFLGMLLQSSLKLCKLWSKFRIFGNKKKKPQMYYWKLKITLCLTGEYFLANRQHTWKSWTDEWEWEHYVIERKCWARSECKRLCNGYREMGPKKKKILTST